MKILAGDTTNLHPVSESDITMISETGLSETTSTTLRRAAVTLPPKRRSKLIRETPAITVMPVPAVSHRYSRMKRSGQMSLHWRTGSDDQRANSVRISPEILRAA
jgi:hypothetical protein